MKNYRSIIFLINLLVWLVSSHPNRRKSETTRKFDGKTGEAIAVDHLIKRYEKEHGNFYLQKTKSGAHLEWPTLNSKNLSNYCRKYLQHSVPTVNTDNAIGNPIRIHLHYGNGKKKVNSNVVTVHCKVKRNRPLSYYITRAPEPNCVYSLKRTTCSKKGHIFTIICKHCDFEDKPFVERSLKRKREEIINTIHRTSGQPIARDEYLLKYELEHQEMIKKEGIEGKNIEWPFTNEYIKLDYYCYQYIGECAPGRQRDGTTGSWKLEKLNYQKLNTKDNEDIIVAAVTCITSNVSQVHYYMTRAPESNCVYALLRQGSNQYHPFVIIYKHCDFKDDNDYKTIPKGYDILDKNLIPKLEVKEEMFDREETLQFLPED